MASMEEEMRVYDTHAGKVNKILGFFSGILGLYDFGGKNYVAPLPEVMDLNGKKQRIYIFTFEDGE